MRKISRTLSRYFRKKLKKKLGKNSQKRHITKKISLKIINIKQGKSNYPLKTLKTTRCSSFFPSESNTLPYDTY